MKNKSNFDKAIENYLNNIDSLRSTLPEIIDQISKLSNDCNSVYHQFLKEECDLISPQQHYKIRPDQNRKWLDLKKKATSSSLALSNINRSFLTSLISQFDTYIGDLIRCVFEARPDLIDKSEKQLTFAQLQSFEDIASAREYVIEKEIETVLRESHSEQFHWFESKLSLKLRKDLASWKTFVEVTQRRNLFVHNDGKVTNQYLNVCKQNNVSLLGGLTQGTILSSNIPYFKKAFDCLFEIGVKLNQVLRRNLLPEEINAADESFVNITYELVVNKQYELAKELFDFAAKYIKRLSTKDVELRIALNRAQTYKWLGEEEKCNEIIAKHDWTVLNDLFKLASQVLADDFQAASNTMIAIGDNEKLLHKAYYRDWPIFQKFRETSEFSDAYNTIYDTEEITVLESEIKIEPT